MNEPREELPFDPEDSVRIVLGELGRSHVCNSEEKTSYAIVSEPHNERCPEPQREWSRQRFPVE